MPALLIRKSRCRKCLLKSWKRAATERSSRTSELLRITRAAPAATRSGAAGLKESIFRAVSAKLQPRKASALAIARPIPRLAPVTTATLPFNTVPTDPRCTAAASGCEVSPARSGCRRESRLLVAILLCSDQREEFLARLRVLTKDAQHGRRDCCRMLFLDPSHHHAEMARFDHNTNALGLDGILDGFGNFGGQALLHLEAPRKDLDQAWQLAETDDFAVGHVSNVNFAEKRQHVVLAKAKHLDVLHDHHLVIADGEQCLAQDILGTLGVAARQKFKRRRHTCRRTQQAFTARILADTLKYFADQVGQACARKRRR